MTRANPKPIAHGADPRHAKLASLIDAGVIRRAGIVALVLGSVLTLANQSGAIFGGGTVQVLPLVLVYLTPFVVVTVSQVLGIRRALLDAGRGRASVWRKFGRLADRPDWPGVCSPHAVWLGFSSDFLPPRGACDRPAASSGSATTVHLK